MPPGDRVNGLAYNLALSTVNEHLVMPAATHSRFTNEQMAESLVYLSVEERYAESGLEDLASTRQVPSADALLYRLKKLKSEEALGMLAAANDEVIEELRRRGVFRKPVIAAADLTDDPYYGEYNNRVRRSKRETGGRTSSTPTHLSTSSNPERG